MIKTMPKLYCRQCDALFKTAGIDRIVCPNHTFEIVNSVPRLSGGANYAQRFGTQWVRFARTQLDSVSGLRITEERLKRCISPMRLHDLAGRDVLEIGCGAGRFTEILLKYGARVSSLDLSEAVDANIANFPASDSHQVVQADASEAPFSDGTFDLVLCLGVLQHTADQRAILDSMYRLAKSGGIIVFDNYRLTLSFVTRLLPFYRWILLKLDVRDSIGFCERLVDRLLGIHRLFGSTLIGYALLTRISPIVTYFHCFTSLTLAQQREWAVLDTHDSLFDRHKRLHTKWSLRRVLRRLPLRVERLAKGGIGLEVFAVRSD